MRFPRLTERGMLQHATAPPHRRKSARETAAVVAGPVVLPAPALEVDRRELAPKLARRMCHDGQHAHVGPRIPFRVPWVDARKACIGSVLFDKKCGHVSHGCVNRISMV